MTGRTPAQVGKASRMKGARAELAVVSWLRANGFGNAERFIRTGYKSATRTSTDPGDITGTPGLVWQVTDREDIDQDAVLTRRMAETETQRAHANAAYGFLVVRRRGYADPGRWWCWLPADVLADLVYGHNPHNDVVFPVRAELGDVVRAVRRRGFGDPLDDEAPD